ncbi:MAG TPA: hypothetical protein VMW75_27640 [Thermoanaerobaculia bacterium]|nr:hypothetical protein [Thermoanaerobaculia bacterium]
MARAILDAPKICQTAPSVDGQDEAITAALAAPALAPELIAY